MPAKRYLFYIEQNYSFEILRPLQDEIINRGDQVKWLAIGTDVNRDRFTASELRLHNVEQAIAYAPHACFVPGNIIPSFIPGIKVQVFHGLEWKKKGHFIIRDCFDLYCTHGAATTTRFEQLASKHGYFDVVETGWPKLDNLFSTAPYANCPNDKKIILYAPTFSPSLTSASKLFDEINTLRQQHDWHWLVKFHPKMDAHWVEQYQRLQSDNFTVIASGDIGELLQGADIMVSDTSSVIGEFSLLGKPVIALNNSQPGDYLINISNAQQLEAAIHNAFNPGITLKHAIEKYAQQLHPYTDGKSSSRIVTAVEKILAEGKRASKKMPKNLFRTLKLRKKLHYWRW